MSQPHHPSQNPKQRKTLEFITHAPPRPPRKRLFIGLVTASSVLLCLLLLVGWIIPVIGFGNIHSSVPFITGILLACAIATIAWSAIGLVMQMHTGRSFWGSDRVRGLAIQFFLPLMELLGLAFGFSRDDVRRSYIKVNNQLSLSKSGIYSPDRILILLPHCVQNADCSIRLSYRIDACKRCGKCPLAGFLALRDGYGVNLAVATGGSIARRLVVDMRPALILAVACERDLASGIQDTHPIPVFGILNHRPEGPCRNTVVRLTLVEDALRQFITPESLPKTFVCLPEAAIPAPHTVQKEFHG